MMNFKNINSKDEYYKLKEEHYWNNYTYFGSLATAHSVKGGVHAILFKYYIVREGFSHKKYRKYLEKTMVKTGSLN